LAGNQWRAKFETMASPDSRSERGRKLQRGVGWTPGAPGFGVVGLAAVLMVVLRPR
jgi:hypothetical protein